MKKIFFPLAIFLQALLISNEIFACTLKGQTDSLPPQKGYWVIESNLKAPKSATVYFYNGENTLVYRETVEGVKLNINRIKVRRQLNAILQQSLTAWQQQQLLRENQQLIAKKKNHK